MTRLAWTGERFLPGEGGPGIAYEHYTRYLFASLFASGKRVIDIGSGEGYGAFLLAKSAVSVLGVDPSADAVLHASNRYIQPNLKFRKATASDVLPDGEGSFDLITCFEMIEHVTASQQHEVLSAALRLLSSTGILLISTPNRPVYREAGGPGYTNEFHLHEMDFPEFNDFLSIFFGSIRWLAQGPLSGNLLRYMPAKGEKTKKIGAWRVEAAEISTGDLKFETNDSIDAAKYFFAVCARKPNALSSLEMPEGMVFVDLGGSLEREKTTAVNHVLSENLRLAEESVRLLQTELAAISRENEDLKESNQQLLVIQTDLERLSVQKKAISENLRVAEESVRLLQAQLARVSQENEKLKESNRQQISSMQAELERSLIKRDRLLSDSSIECDRLHQTYGLKLANLEESVQFAQKDLAASAGEKTSLHEMVTARDAQIANLNVWIGRLNADLAVAMTEKDQLLRILSEIYKGDVWQAASTYYRARERYAVVKYPYLAARKAKALLKGTHALPQPVTIEDRPPPPETPKAEPQFSDPERLAKDNPPLTSFDLLVFSEECWEEAGDRIREIVKRQAVKNHRVFFIRAGREPHEVSLFRQIAPEVVEVRLKTRFEIPEHGDRPAPDAPVWTREIEAIMALFRINGFVTYTRSGIWQPLALYLKEKYSSKTIFDGRLHDADLHGSEHGSATPGDNRLLTLLSQADLVIRESDEEADRVIPGARKIRVLRDGFDFESFHTPPAIGGLESFGKPVIGYFGRSVDHLDRGLLLRMAGRRPEWNIVLVGEFSRRTERDLKTRRNIHLLGKKPVDTLPAYAKSMDVIMLPLKPSGFSASYETSILLAGLAAGKPVVCPNLLCMRPWKGFVSTASSNREFCDKVEAVLSRHSFAARMRGVEAARRSDWNRVVSDLDSMTRRLHPLVSIIVLTYNHFELTVQCIDSIFQKTDYPNYELIVVDNASTDETREYLKKLQAREPNVKVILNEKNLGFAGGNNCGLKEASGEFLILLNNDTVVTRGWLNGLLWHLKDPTVGAVGPVTNNIGNEARINTSYEDLDGMESFAGEYTTANFRRSQKIKVLAMFCMAFPSSVVSKIGLLDEQFEIGMFEDDDYSIRIKNAGYELLCAEDVFIHHVHGGTFFKLDPSFYNEILARNRARFEKKWDMEWEPHRLREGVN